MARARKTMRVGFRRSDNPDDPLYKRAADSLCAVCSDHIGEADFELAYSEMYGTDQVVHVDCADQVK